MQRNWSSILFVLFALAMLGRAVNAAISIECAAGTCEGPLLLVFQSPGCDDHAMAYPLQNAIDHPNVSENTCLPSDELSSMYTCGSGMYRETTWKSNANCGGDPTEELSRLTHVCLPQKVPSGKYAMYVCGPDDLDAPVTLAYNLPNVSDPLAQSNPYAVCPDGICRPGYASATWYNQSSPCTGPSLSKESSLAELGVCNRLIDSFVSIMATCDLNVVRTIYYAGSCNDLAFQYLDVFRAPGSCSLMSAQGGESRSEIYCPGGPTSPALPEPQIPVGPTSPDIPETQIPAPTGHAASLCLPLILTFILFAIISSISL